MSIDEARLRAALADSTLPVYCYDSIDSTNTECKRRIAAGERRFLVLGDTQTAGRGRRGHSFFSPPGAGLYLSLTLTPPSGPGSAVGITTRAAVCTAAAIEKLCGISCGIKWVNDLYREGKKVCGILTEAVGGSVVVGIGVNLAASAVPAELREIVGWLDCPELREPLAAEIVNGLLAYVPGDTGHMPEYRRRCLVLGRRGAGVRDRRGGGGRRRPGGGHGRRPRPATQRGNLPQCYRRTEAIRECPVDRKNDLVDSRI